MSGSDEGNGGMTPAAARKVEYAIIGLGVLALLMIFQPFDITLFAVGCVLVVLAALVNNLLPLAQPGVPARSVVTGGDDCRHDLLHCPAGRDLRGLSLRRVLPQAAGSQHHGRQGPAQRDALVHAQLHMDHRDCRLRPGRPDRNAEPAQELKS